MVFWPCEGVLGPELCRMKAGRQSQGLELVSSTLGYGPQARSVLHCHGVLALRGGPWPGAVQDESWQAKSRLGASF